MGLVDRLKKRLEGTVAQVNPFDNGQTYSSVVNTPAPTAAPSASVAMPNPQDSAPAPHRNVASRIFDQINPLDSGRTFKQAEPTKAPTSVFHQAVHNGLTDFAGNSIVKPAVRLGIAVNQGVANAELKLAGRPTLNAEDFTSRSYTPSFNRAIDYKGTKRQIAGDAITTGINVIAPGTSKLVENGATKVLPGFVPKVVPKLIAGTATGAALGGPQNVGTLLSDSNAPITADNLTKAYKQGIEGGAIFGAGAELLPYGFKATDAAVRSIRDLPRQVKDNTLKLATHQSPVQSVPTSRLISYEGAPDRARVNYYKDQINSGQHPDPIIAMTDSTGRLGVEDGKHKLQAYRELGIKNVPAKIMTPEDIKKISQGGYVRLPGAGDEAPALPRQTLPTDTSISDSNVVENQLSGHQEIASPTNIAPEQAKPDAISVVEHQIENEAANRTAIQNSELDRAVQADLGRAGARTGDIVQAHAERSGLPTQEAAKDVWRIAQHSGYDIRDGVPYRVQPDATPLSRAERGAQTEQSDLEALNAATDQLKVGASKGLIGVEHAVTLKETPHQRLNAYVDKNGDIKTYIEQKRADGNWHEILNSHAPIKHADDSRGILKLLGDPQIQEEVSRASNDGITRQYIWTEDANGTSSGLRTSGRKDPVTPTTMEFDPETQTVAGGFVRNKETGEIIGNYVAVGPNGIQVQVGRQFITIPLDAAKLSDAKGGNNSFNQAERWIEAVTKDEPTREQLRNLVVYPTREAEANLKVEANALGEGIKSWRKALNRSVSPVKRKGMMRDAVYVIEPDRQAVRQLGANAAKSDALEAFTNTYGQKAADVLSKYDEWVRSVYDNLLERQNAVRRHNGLDEIPKRQDYLTHTQELNGGLGQLYQDLHDGIFGEVEGGSVRGKLPAQIAGRTENFKPIQKYNPFAKQRSGDGKPLNPFDPVSTYAGVALHNIHLTKPAAIVRSLETALRAAQEFATNKPEGLTGAAAERYDTLAKRFGGNYGDAVEWLTEHANILSGKSSNFNRLVLKSSGGRKALNLLKFMQRQTGRANIIGNVSSVVSQTLNLPSTLGTNGIRSTISGIARSLGSPADNAAWRKSNFLKERYVDGSVLRNKNALEKVLTPLGIPLGVVERAFVHIAWNSSYDKALARGFEGDAAIRAADSATSKIVSGRSIGDTPHVYNNLLGSTVLQFTREQTEAWKNFTKDQSVYGKALTLVAAAGMNHLVKSITGRAPLPDPLTAAIQTVNDFRGANNNNNQDNSTEARTGRAAQRLATTVVSAVPAASAVANQLPQNTRKTLFGSNSDLGRYEGTVALTGPVTNAIDSAKAAVAGHYTTAAQDAIATLPGGGQARKTWQGLQTAANGVVDKNGVVTTEVNPSASNYVRGSLFGKNAIPEVQQSYEPNAGIASNGSLGEALRNNDKQQKRLQLEFQKSLSPEENDLRKLSADERTTLVDEGAVSADQLVNVDRKVLAVKKRLGIVPGVGGQTIPKLAKDVPQDIKDFYKDRAYVTDADLTDWQSKQADGSAKGLVDTANQIRPDGSPELPQTNRIAELYANFVKQRAEGKWGKEKENVEKGKFLVAAYKTTLSPQQQEWYGLSDTQIQQAIDDGEIRAPDLSELVNFDDHMRGVGLPGEVGNTLRENYGFQTWTAPGAKPKKAKKFSAPPGYFSNASTIGQFRKLIANAKL